MAEPKNRIANLYRLHFGELQRYLSSRVASRELAADLVQELFLRLLARDGSVANITHERGFLFASARNLAAEARRSPRWHDHALPEAPTEDGIGEVAPPPEIILQDKQDVAQLLEVVANLPPRCREAFILHKFDGLSYPEVASRLGISVSMVEKHLMRAMDDCRAQVSRSASDA